MGYCVVPHREFCSFESLPIPPSVSGNFSLVSCMLIPFPLHLRISNDPPQRAYGFVIEQLVIPELTETQFYWEVFIAAFVCLCVHAWWFMLSTLSLHECMLVLNPTIN